ncbi:MAG: DUF4348 domain-containing protein [Tissierellia bacterium]|nr:DUF4348 domain-containing protein [Tissierellia bacterium]
MKYFCYYVVIFILVACKNINNSATNEQIEKYDVFTNPIYSDEDFTIFFNRFKKDSLFQFKRCSEIITIYEYDDFDNLVRNFKSKKDIKFIDFTKDSISYNLEENAYKVEITQTKDSVDYHLWGIDNGIDVSFIFKKRDSIWILSSIYDFSN